MSEPTTAKPRRRGRPVKSREPETFRSLVEFELRRKHRVCLNGRYVRRTLLEIICEHLVLEIIRGNKKAGLIARRLQKDLKEVPAMQPLIIRMTRGLLKVA